MLFRSEGNKQTAESSNFSKRPFQRIVSANVPTKFANSPIKENDRKSEPPPESQTKIGEMDMETQVLRKSTHQMLELLNHHDQAKEQMYNGIGLNSNRKTRRLPPSMRNRNRRTSRTPTSEDRTEDEIGKFDVEEMLAKGREREAMMIGMHEQQQQQSSSLNPFAIQNTNEESMRVIYDDPAGRRERRKIEAMINNSKQTDEVKEKHDNGPNSHISATNTPSPAKKIRTTISGFSPSIKARRQPGTANRDS